MIARFARGAGARPERPASAPVESVKYVVRLESSEDRGTTGAEGVLERLARAGSFRHEESAEHVERVSRTCALIARELGWAGPECGTLRVAAAMHDIGKVGVPDAILHKPGRLTPEEFEVMKTHTTIGARILAGGKSEVSAAAERIALRHHERWDGQGYPGGLSGESIPLFARIVAVADAEEAMASDRPYHCALSSSEVIAEVRRCAGTHFDPKIVEAFIRVAERVGEGFIANSANEVERRQAEHANHAVSSALSVAGQLSQVV